MSSTTESTSEQALVHDYVAANQEHFDKVAAKVDVRPDLQELARLAASAILSQHGSLLDPDSTTLMDFACGTGMSDCLYYGVCIYTCSSGLVTLQLVSHVKSILGVDLSSGMVRGCFIFDYLTADIYHPCSSNN